MTEEEKYDWIESYLRQELTGSELESFENRLSTDLPFQEEVKLHAEITGVLADYEKFQLKRMMLKRKGDIVFSSSPGKQDSHHNEIQPKSKDKKTRRLLPMLMAAAALFVLLFGLLFLFNQPINNSTLAEQYFVGPEQLIEVDRSNKSVKVLEEINADFQSQDYQSSLQKLTNSKDIPPRDRDLYRSICFIAIDNDEVASKLLDPLSSDTRYERRDDALWYQSLALLKLEEVERAKEKLTELAKLNSGRSKQAKELLSKINA